jgi:SAM-dependent methyltransferase
VSLEEWNARYRAREEMDDQPAKLLVEAVAGLPPGRALDLACGAGRNAIWLARNGWEVTAVDGASEAIRVLRQHEPQVDARVLDLETGAPLPFDDDSFDLAVILYYLHRPLFAEARRVVKPGGMMVTAVRTLGINPRFCVRPGELVTFFEGWDVLHQHDGEIAEVVVRRRS